MKRIVIVLAVAVVVAFGIWAGTRHGQNEEPKPFVMPPAERSLGMDWVSARPPGWDLQIGVPRDWTDGYKQIRDGREWHFGGPKDDGWRIELIFGWMPSKKGLDWWEDRVDAYATDPRSRVLRRGRTTVAGLPALFCLQTYGGRLGAMKRIDYMFAGRGGIGFVRGIATARTFEKYAPIFQEAARRVRYRRQ